MGLQENIRTEPVKRLKIRDVVSVKPNVKVADVAELMRKTGTGCAVVIDENQKPLGVFTESNLIEVLAHQPAAVQDPIDQHMAARFPWVRENDPIADVLDAMQLKNVRILCVMDESDRVIGLTGQRGLMEYVAEHFPGEVMVQRVGQSSFLSDREGA